MSTVADFLNQKFDYLVIGGGTAGLAVAARLSEDPELTVGVLEAGPVVLDNHDINIPGFYGQTLASELDWQFETVSQPGLASRKLPWPRGKVVGGTSALNFMTWNRASREDYDAWEELGNHGWGWDDLLPFFKKSERFHIPDQKSRDENKEYYDEKALGVDGPVHIAYSREYSASHKLWHPTLNSLGVQTNKAHLSGSNVGVWTNVSSVDLDGAARSFASTAYYRPNASRTNLFVLAEALVTEIDIQQHQDGECVAQGVRFSHHGDEHYVPALREVILSAGSVQSPQLLELSGVGSRQILSRSGVRVKVENPNVGENLQDHISYVFCPSHMSFKSDKLTTSVTAIIIEVDPALDNPDDLKTDDAVLKAALKQREEFKTGPLTILPCSICYLPVSHFMSDETVASLAAKVDGLVDLAPERREILKRRFGDTAKLGQIEYIFDLGNWNPHFTPKSAEGKKYGTMLQILQYPFSRGSIHIQQPGIADKPAIDPQYYSGVHGQMDLDMMIDCAQFADRICRTKPLAGIIRSRAFPAPVVSSEKEWRDWVINSTITDWHPVGTCAMGGQGKIKAGVVDERLRVYSVRRLRVVDASIMPLQISAHLQATVYAIAEKGASMIREDMMERCVVP